MTLFSPAQRCQRLLTRGLLLIGLLCLGQLHAQQEPSSNNRAPVVIVSYNVDNYLTMPRWVNGRYRSSAGKPESEKKAVATILASLHPDIIAFMEVGDLRQVQDLERHLRQCGLDYPYSEYVQGWDPVRHLLLLSRFPFLEKHSQGIIPLLVDGTSQHSTRGILDVTIALKPNDNLRLIALHLKSKVPVAEYNEASFRAAEALYCRNYIRTILSEDPKTKLLVMGDFNDTKNSKTIFSFIGTPKLPGPVQALSLTDDRGELWTEYWKQADEYSRIDYMMVSQALMPSIVQEHSGIARPSSWNEASDHCPLFITVAPKEETPPIPAQ